MKTLNHKNTVRLFILLLVFLVGSMSSCVPLKRIKYAQEPVEDSVINSYLTAQTGLNTINPYDELFIRISSFDEKTYQFFNPYSYGNNNLGNQAANIYSYTVAEDGFIDYPFVGRIHLAGLTLLQAQDSVEAALSMYLADAEATVKFTQKYITILGEVNSPGQISFQKEKINLYEMIAMAGDLTIHADRKNVTLIRQEGDSTKYYYIDVTHKDLVESEFYYLQPNDIIYVEPLRSKQWGLSVSAPESVMRYLGYFTTLMSVYLIVNNL